VLLVVVGGFVGLNLAAASVTKATVPAEVAANGVLLADTGADASAGEAVPTGAAPTTTSTTPALAPAAPTTAPPPAPATTTTSTSIAPAPPPPPPTVPSSLPPAIVGERKAVGCAAEPFATGFAAAGVTPDQVGVASCEIVDDIPEASRDEMVCGQLSGPEVAQTIHLARRTVDGGCRREPVGVVVHEVGHAWHLQEATRTWRVLQLLGLDPDDLASFEVVAECFVEAVGYLDTACTPAGAATVGRELAASLGHPGAP
jgi:hypothetical protein